MANRKSSSREGKANKTIDLTANKVENEETDSVAVKSDEGSSGYDILKSKDAPDNASDIVANEMDEASKSETDLEEKSDNKGAGNEPEEQAGEPDVAPALVEPVKSRGMGSMILSAVLGGGVALGGASLLGQNSALQSVPVIGGLFAGADNTSKDSAELETLQSQLSDLAGQLEALKTTPVSDPTATEALEVAKAAQSASQAASSQITEIADRMLENPNGAAIDLDGLKASLAGDQAALSERITALETAGQAQLPQSLQDELAAIKEQVAKLDAMEQSTGELSQSLAAMDERVQAVETSINDTVLPSMESVQAAAGAAVESQKVARSVSARALGSVLENGGSFAGELAAAEALVGQSDSISALKAQAGKGILTVSALIEEFNKASDRILSASSNVVEDKGFVDKLMSSAMTLVKVRPAGPVAGDTNGAVVSRIGASLKEGNLTEALNQWESLSDEAKAVSADWAGNARERAQAETYINNIIGELGQSSPNQG